MHSGMFTIDHHRKWITGVTMGVVATDDITSGWWFGTFFPTYWEESSQLTFICFRGVAQPPTRLSTMDLHKMVEAHQSKAPLRTRGKGR